MSDIRTSRKQADLATIELPQADWKRLSGTVYRCKVIIVFPPEEDTALISVYAADLPGVASQGKTEEEALKNIVEAFEGVLSAYKAVGETIPWQEHRGRLEPGAQIRWVFVHG